MREETMDRIQEQIILPNGDVAERRITDLIVRFAGPRRVLGTSRLNGGYREDLGAVFNHCDMQPESGRCVMRAPTYREHLALAARDAGLDPARVSGLSTALDMKYMQMAQRSRRGVQVTALVTGGILHNGRRAGDPATMWEEHEKFYLAREDGVESFPESGTVNIILHLTADMTENAMVTAVMVAAEAKAAAIQEEQLLSCYGDGFATGSGTDGVIVIADATSQVLFTQTGTDTVAGECIAQAVKEAVRKSLILNCKTEGKASGCTHL